MVLVLLNSLLLIGKNTMLLMAEGNLIFDFVEETYLSVKTIRSTGI